jgi:hypothetical protein
MMRFCLLLLLCSCGAEDTGLLAIRFPLLPEHPSSYRGSVEIDVVAEHGMLRVDGASGPSVNADYVAVLRLAPSEESNLPGDTGGGSAGGHTHGLLAPLTPTPELPLSYSGESWILHILPSALDGRLPGAVRAASVFERSASGSVLLLSGDVYSVNAPAASETHAH